MLLYEVSKISPLAVLHYDMEFLLIPIKVVLVYFDQVRVQELPHDVDFLFC